MNTAVKPMAYRGRVRGQRISMLRETLKVFGLVLAVTLLPISCAALCAYGWST